MAGRIFPNSTLFRSHSHVAWVSTKSKAMREQHSTLLPGAQAGRKMGKHSYSMAWHGQVGEGEDGCRIE